MEIKGRVHKVGAHIDTDAIIPARFLVTTDKEELGKHCMEGLEPGWINRISKGDILVAGPNFGCGSSREHAPLALLGAGISLVVAHSFARIFYRNAFNMGLPLVEIGEDVDKIEEGDVLVVDLEGGKILNDTKGETLEFPSLPEFMLDLLKIGGLVNYVKTHLREKKSGA